MTDIHNGCHTRLKYLKKRETVAQEDIQEFEKQIEFRGRQEYEEQI